MKHKKWIFLIIIVASSMMTGCYNYRELNQLAIASAIGIDKIDDGFRVVVQVMDTQKQGSDSSSSGGSPKFTVYTQDGKDLQEAFRKVILESPRRLYVDHLQLLVISEELARSGIHDILDLMFRDTEVRKQFLILVSKEKNAEDVLSILTPLEPLNAKNIKDSIVSDSKYLGLSEKQNFEEIIGNYLNDKIEITLAGIEILGNEEDGEKEDNIKESIPETRVKLTPTVIFKGDKMLDFVNEKQGFALSFIKNQIQNTIISHGCGDRGNVAVELVGSKTSIKASDTEPKITISITNKSNINEITCNVDLQDSKVIAQMEKDIEEEIWMMVSSTIQELNEKYNTDIYGFRDVFYRSNPKHYQQLMDQFGDDFLKNIEVEVKVDTKLQAKGNAHKVIPYVE